MKNHLYFLFFFLASILLASCTEEKPVNVKHTFQVAKDVKQSIGEYNEVEFNNPNSLNLGFYRGNIWVKLEIDNSDAYRTLMFTNNDLFNRNYTFYKIDSQKESPVLIEKINGHSKYDNRTFNDPYPNFKIDLNPNEKTTYIITSKSDGRTTDATPKLLTIQEYSSINNQSIIWSIVFLGAVIVLLIINLYLWNLHKNDTYKYYISYMLASLIMYTGFDGFFYNLNLSLALIDHIIFLSVRIWVLALIVFTTKFLDIKNTAPLFYKYSLIALVIVLGGNTLYQFIFYNTSIQYLHYYENTLSFFYLLLIFGFVFVAFRARKIELKYYLISLSFFVTFIIIGLLDGQFQILPSTPFVYIKIGTLIEFIGFTYFMTVLIKKKLLSKQVLEVELSKNQTKLQEKEKQLASKSSLISIYKLIENSFENESDWDDFKEKFESLNPNFTTSLLAKHPELTKSEIRLITLIKIGYSQKEIANILNIAPDSVKKSRGRVRKKMNLDESIMLSDYLNEIKTGLAD